MNNYGMLAVVALMCAPFGTVAQSSEVAVTGRVIAVTCNAGISPNGLTAGTSDYTVTLPAVPTTALGMAGTTTGEVNFFISLSACSPGVIVPYFQPGANLTMTGGRLQNTAPAAGRATSVELQIRNDQDVPVDLAANKGAQSAGEIPVVNGAGSKRYSVRYYATGAAGTGTVAGTMVWGIDYK